MRTLALVLPLAIDTFAATAALAVAGLTPAQRRRATVLFPAFEAGMPLLGLAGGALAGRAAGGVAAWIAIGVILATGAWMLAEREEGHGAATVALAASVSVDELAVGFSLGLLGVPAVEAIALIALQAVVASQAGLRLGARLGARAGERAERLAGVALLVAGAVLLVSRW